MGWKDLPYWLKGGIILIAIRIIAPILSLILGIYIPAEVFPRVFLIGTFLNIFAKFLTYNLPILDLLVNFVEAFIVGIILGWIYGKIRAEPKFTQKSILIGAIIGLVIALIGVGFANMDWLPSITNIIFLGLYESIGQAE